MRRTANLVCGALILLVGAHSLFAASGRWSSVAADSELTFSAYYEGEELPGRFATFSVTLDIQEETAAPAALRVEVKTASADMNDREVNAEIVEPEWFDAQSFPAAVFESQDIEPDGDGFRAKGRLCIKGVEQNLEIPLHWTRESDRGTLTGSARLSRLDWQVGTGEWSNDASLSNRVDVRWRVTLVPAD